MPQPQEQSSAILVRLACDGDEQAWAALYNMYQLRIYTYLAGHVGKVDAHDLLQETFLKALGGIGGLRDPLSFTAWLYSIARHCAYDLLRQKRKFSLQPLEEPSDAEADIISHPVDFTELVMKRELIQETLARLPHRYRDCLLLQAVGGLSYREIASIVSLREGSVGIYLSKARQLFRDMYQDLEQQHGGTKGEVESDGE